MKRGMFAVMAALGFCAMAGAEAAPNPYPNLKKVVIVYKTHFDIGYSEMARNVVHNYRTTMLDNTLENVRRNAEQPKNQQFVWTVPGWPMEQILWEGQAPARKAAIEEALRAGNLTFHALPFTTHTETLEGEDLMRGLSHASNLARKYGQALPTGAKMTDVPCHTWALPTVLANAGVKFFHFGSNLTNWRPEVPTLFWWEGPDGSRLLTMSCQGYGSPRMPPKDWKYSAWLFINQTGDNQGPPSPETVKQDLAYYAKALPGVEVQVGKLADYADCILANDKPETIPVVRGDMPDSWVHGVMSSPKATALARRTRPLIPAAEALQTIEKGWGVFLPNATPTYQKAYEQSLLFGEHTWGYAAQHYRRYLQFADWERTLREGPTPYMEDLERSWDEHDNYIKTAANLITLPLHNEMATLADNVNAPGRRIVVYNPLPWARDGVVTLNMVYWKGGKAFKDLETGELLPMTISGDGEFGATGSIMAFVAKNVPPMGYRTYTFVRDAPKATEGLVLDEAAKIIESPYFKATLDPEKGYIKSLVDKRTGRDLVDSAAPQGFGQYFYERFGKQDVMRFLRAYLFGQYMGSHGPITDKMGLADSVAYTSATSSNMTFRAEKDALSVSAIMTCDIKGEKLGLPQRVSIKLTLFADRPYADLTVRLTKEPDCHPETCWIALPFKVDNPQYRVGRLGAPIDPMTEIIPKSNTRQLYTNTGVAFFNDTFGVGVCPVDSPLVSLGEPGAQHFDRDYKPTKPYLYVALTDNKWATNFREWWGGTLQSTVRLWAFGKYDTESALYTPSMEARVPLMVARSQCGGGKLPITKSALTFSRKGVQLCAFGANPDGEGTLLRLWEQGGKAGPLTITVNTGAFTAAQPVNLRGEPTGAPIPLKDGAFTFSLPAYAPRAFILK